jgi:hypothetical protein
VSRKWRRILIAVTLVAISPLSANLLKHSTLKVYPGYPHGKATVHADRINAELLAFVKTKADRTAVFESSRMRSTSHQRDGWAFA